MAHTFLIAVLGLGLTLSGCDTQPPAKVPREAGRALHPAEVKRMAAVVQPAPIGDPIVAWVNDEPIHASSVEAHVQRTRGAANPALVDGRREHVLQRLIDERLIEQWLSKQELEVPEGEIDAAIERKARTIFGDAPAFAEYLAQRRMTLSEYRAQTRGELAQARLLGGAEVSMDALRDLYREVANRPASRIRLNLSSVLLSADHGLSEAQLRHIEDESAFRELPGRQVALGWVERDSLGESLARAILAVTPPGGTAPLQTPAGTEIYWVHELRDEPTPHFVEVEPTLRRRAEDISIGQARADLLRQLRASGSVRLADPATR